MLANYVFSFLAVPTAVTAAASFALGFWLARHERYSAVSLAFLGMTTSVGLWQLGMSGVYFSNNAASALFWQKVTFLGVPFIPISLCHFSSRVLGIYKRRMRVLVAGWIIAVTFMAYAIAANGIFIRMELYSWGYYPIYGPLGIPLLLFYAVFFGLCFVDYWRALQTAEPERRRERIRLLLTGFLIAAIAVVDFLPTYGVAVYPFGYAPVFVCLMITAYTVRKYHLVDIVPEFAAQQIISTIADSLVVCDVDGRIRVVNQAACVTLGYREDELLGKPLDFLAGSSRSAADRIGELISRPMVRDEEFVFWSRNSEPVDVSLSASRIDDPEHGMLGSVVVARDIRERKMADARLQEEADIASALARVGGELISVLDRPVLLEQLCALTTDVLQADASYTLLWRPTEDVFTPVASHGATPEEREAARLVNIPRSMMDVLFGRFDHDDIAESRTVPDEVFANVVPIPGKLPANVCIALRRGDEVIGIQVAIWRGSGRPLTSRDRRIARGISQLASFALENARLMTELNEADKLRSEFVATMSHELRTPLGVIIGYTDLLLDGALGELRDEQNEALERVRKNSWDLLELIGSTLDLSRLQRGRLPLCLTETSLTNVLRQIQEETRAQVDKPNIRLEWRVPELPVIYTDPSKLKVVLKNLVLNALKFTEEGEVVVEAKANGSGVECIVRDTGIGMESDKVNQIFEPFRQINGNGRQYGGVGLGLYIVRRFLDMLGGSIDVESELGRGSTFRVTVPLSVVGDAEEA